LLLLSSAAAARADVPADLQKLLTELPARGVQCSALAVDLETGRTLCDVNSQQLLLPASCAKLLVLAAAVEQLGPSFNFRTVLAVRGNDLVLMGDGDPGLGDPRLAQQRGEAPEAVMDRWSTALATQGLNQFSGSLVIDDSIFDDQRRHLTWEPADFNKWYAAPVGGLNFNDNCVDVTVWRENGPGAALRWQTVPKAEGIEVLFRDSPGRKGDPVIDRPGDDLRFIVTGRPVKRMTFSPIPVTDPGLVTAAALRAALADKGIRIAGPTIRNRVRRPDGSLPADCRVVAEQTTPLADALARAGRNSQNLFAECLMKRLGYEWARRKGAHDPQGSWDAGRSAIEAFLAGCCGSAPTATVADGSGLSRENRISAAELVAVLRHVHRHPQRDLFASSLSEAGQDGTLGKRMKDLNGTVYAKTGYLRGVRTLSGYVVTPQGKWRAFSVMFNGFSGGSAPYNQIHDQVCRLLATDEPLTPEVRGKAGSKR